MKIEELEKILGYKFKDKKLLENALVHRSYTNESKVNGSANNERLEFLGDAVLEIVVSDYLYRNIEKNEGDLSRLRAAIVCEKALSSWCIDNNLGKFIKLGNGEDVTGGRKRPSVLSDCIEAIFGAIYLDGGLEEASKIIHMVIGSILKNKEYFIDNKTKLQELTQSKENVKLEYVLINEEGPDHGKVYTMQVRINDEPYGVGKGTSKKTAQQEAARQALKKLETKENDVWKALGNDIKRSRN